MSNTTSKFGCPVRGVSCSGHQGKLPVWLGHLSASPCVPTPELPARAKHLLKRQHRRVPALLPLHFGGVWKAPPRSAVEAKARRQRVSFCFQEQRSSPLHQHRTASASVWSPQNTFASSRLVSILSQHTPLRFWGKRQHYNQNPPLSLQIR